MSFEARTTTCCSGVTGCDSAGPSPAGLAEIGTGVGAEAEVEVEAGVVVAIVLAAVVVAVSVIVTSLHFCTSLSFEV